MRNQMNLKKLLIIAISIVLILAAISLSVVAFVKGSSSQQVLIDFRTIEREKIENAICQIEQGANSIVVKSYEAITIPKSAQKLVVSCHVDGKKDGITEIETSWDNNGLSYPYCIPVRLGTESLVHNTPEHNLRDYVAGKLFGCN